MPEDYFAGEVAARYDEGLGERFSLAYVVFKTINSLTTQEAQVACFENVSAQLAPRGCFVVEVGVPRAGPLRVFALSETHAGIDEYDAATQRLVSHHFSLVDGSWVRLSIPFRSVSPAELDLMARLAGLRLRERWSGWKREPFTSESTRHVSVWERTAGGGRGGGGAAPPGEQIPHHP